jgi:hypothetical protein
MGQQMARIVSELVRKYGNNGQNGERKPPQQWNSPHKFEFVPDDTWLWTSSFLSTWSLFLSPKELRIIEFVSQTLVIYEIHYDIPLG